MILFGECRQVENGAKDLTGTQHHLTLAPSAGEPPKEANSLVQPPKIAGKKQEPVVFANGTRSGGKGHFRGSRGGTRYSQTRP